jgi:hypothetical protein
MDWSTRGEKRLPNINIPRREKKGRVPLVVTTWVWFVSSDWGTFFNSSGELNGKRLIRLKSKKSLPASWE